MIKTFCEGAFLLRGIFFLFLTKINAQDTTSVTTGDYKVESENKYSFTRLSFTAADFLEKGESKKGELIYLFNAEKDIHVQIFSYDQAEFYNNLTNKDSVPEGAELLPTFHKTYCNEGIKLQIANGVKIKTEPVSTKIMVNGRRAMQIELTISISEKEFICNYLSIKGSTEYIHTIAFFPISTEKEDIIEIVNMLESFIVG